MPVSQCVNGHYYDSEKFSACPHCEETPNAAPKPNEESKTVAMYSADIFSSAKIQIRDASAEKGDKTIAFYQSEMNMDPVVGWLVCVEGKERGRDYRLHSGRNFIGRALRMDVMLADDDQITRENHCSVVYDKKGNTFSLVPGEGTNTYINGELLADPAPIADDDVIRLGATELVFNAFCKGERKWV